MRFKKNRVETPQILLLVSSRTRAKKRNIPFALTVEWANSAWTGRCAVTGISFELGTGRVMRSPSLDRIKPELGYVPENCRFVLWAVNTFKGTGTDTEMLEVAKAMVQNFSV